MYKRLNPFKRACLGAWLKSSSWHSADHKRPLSHCTFSLQHACDKGWFTSRSLAKRIEFTLMLHMCLRIDDLQREEECKLSLNICIGADLFPSWTFACIVYSGKLPCMRPSRNLASVSDNLFISVWMCCCKCAVVALPHLVKSHDYKFRLRSPGAGHLRLMLLNKFDRDSSDNHVVPNVSSVRQTVSFPSGLAFLSTTFSPSWRYIPRNLDEGPTKRNSLQRHPIRLRELCESSGASA